MASWRDRFRSESTPPTSPEPILPVSEMHGRAQELVSRFADQALTRMFGTMPGADRVAAYLRGRAERELAKLDEATLQRYLRGLEGLMAGVRTGENWQEILQMAFEAMRPEEPAA